MAEALYWEARGEPVEGLHAVADVIMLRLAKKWLGANSVCDVVRAKRGAVFQFEGMQSEGSPKLEPGAWRKVLRVARRTLSGERARIVVADHFWATDGCTRIPAWVSEKLMRPVACIGSHWFWIHS